MEWVFSPVFFECVFEGVFFESFLGRFFFSKIFLVFFKKNITSKKGRIKIKSFLNKGFCVLFLISQAFFS